jgi:hypothetical protein
MGSGDALWRWGSSALSAASNSVYLRADAHGECWPRRRRVAARATCWAPGYRPASAWSRLLCFRKAESVVLLLTRNGHPHRARTHEHAPGCTYCLETSLYLRTLGSASAFHALDCTKGSAHVYTCPPQGHHGCGPAARAPLRIVLDAAHAAAARLSHPVDKGIQGCAVVAVRVDHMVGAAAAAVVAQHAGDACRDEVDGPARRLALALPGRSGSRAGIAAGRSSARTMHTGAVSFGAPGCCSGDTGMVRGGKSGPGSRRAWLLWACHLGLLYWCSWGASHAVKVAAGAGRVRIERGRRQARELDAGQEAREEVRPVDLAQVPARDRPCQNTALPSGLALIGTDAGHLQLRCTSVMMGHEACHALAVRLCEQGRSLPVPDLWGSGSREEEAAQARTCCAPGPCRSGRWTRARRGARAAAAAAPRSPTCCSRTCAARSLPSAACSASDRQPWTTPRYRMTVHRSSLAAGVPPAACLRGVCGAAPVRSPALPGIPAPPSCLSSSQYKQV